MERLSLIKYVIQCSHSYFNRTHELKELKVSIRDELSEIDATKQTRTSCWKGLFRTGIGSCILKIIELAEHIMISYVVPE